MMVANWKEARAVRTGKDRRDGAGDALFLRRLLRERLRRAMVPALALWGAAAALFLLAGGTAAVRALRPIPLETLTPGASGGAYVSCDVPYLYARYEREVEYRAGRPTGLVTGGGYVFDVRGGGDDYRFLGLFARGEDYTAAKALAVRSRETETPAPMRVEGTLLAMDENDAARYYAAIISVAEAFAADGRMDAAEICEHALAYYINVGCVGDRPTEWCTAALALSLGFIVLGALPPALAGRALRPLRQRLLEDGGAPLDQRLCQFYDETPPIGGVRLGDDFVLLTGRGEPVLLRPWDIAWVYEGGGRRSCCIFRTMGGTAYEQDMRPKEAQALLGELADRLPGAILGYSEELERLYAERRDLFAARWARARSAATMDGTRRTARSPR